MSAAIPSIGRSGNPTLAARPQLTDGKPGASKASSQTKGRRSKMGSMSELDGGLPWRWARWVRWRPRSEPEEKSLPWPAYLAVAIAILAVLAFLGFRSYQNRQKLKKHIGFMENFQEFEKNNVGAFWKCLFGKDGDGRRFNSPEALNMQIETALYSDPKTYPEKVNNECLPKALKASRGHRHRPAAGVRPRPRHLRQDAGRAGQHAAGVGRRCPKRVETKLREQKIAQAGSDVEHDGEPQQGRVAGLAVRQVPALRRARRRTS